MTLSPGNVIGKLGADGQVVTGEASRKFKVLATGSTYGVVGKTTAGDDVWGTRKFIEIEEIASPFGGTVDTPGLEPGARNGVRVRISFGGQQATRVWQ